jgi:peptide/nickel transport system substrate-binding protein
VKKNPDYVPLVYEGATGEAAPRYGYFETITWCVNLDATSRTAGLIAGDYHFGSVLTDMQPQALEAGLKAHYLQNEWTPAIFFNLQESNSDSPVYDKNFRKAVRAALDMEAIMLAIKGGDRDGFTLEPSPMSSNSIYYNEIIKNTEWNIADKDLAKQYLEASNYNGESIYWLCSQSASFYQAAVVGIEALKEIGINVEMKLVDAGSHSALRIDPATGHDIGAWETQKATTIPTSQANFVRGDAGGWWTHPEKDRLLGIMQRTVMGAQESIQAYEEFCQLVAEEVPWIAFGELFTVRYGVPELEMNYQGTNAYYWNSYFGSH